MSLLKSLKLHPLRGMASYLTGIAVSTALCACSGYSLTGGPGRTVNPPLMVTQVDEPGILKINSVMIAPVTFDLQARNADTGNLAFFDEVSRALGEEADLEIFADKKIFAAEAAHANSDPSGARALELARKAKSDGVLLTRMHYYVERRGSDVAADQPAEVNFTMSVLSAADGKTVWQANYMFRDQYLTENLFRIGERFKKTEGASWRTASDLFNEGVRLAARDFNQRRASIFVGRS